MKLGQEALVRSNANQGLFYLLTLPGIIYPTGMSPSPLTLYNSFTNSEEVFTPLEPGKVRLYTCGPTVYGRPHIGNYSSFLMADLLRRWLQFGLGYKVTHVKNITDVGHLVADQDEGEDKIEKQAKEECVDPLAIAEKYTEQYLEDEQALNMLEPEQRPKATETIVEMLETIKVLIDKGHAYETEDGYYFSVESFPDYGKLSGNTLENLCAGARVAVDENKKHSADFALWKKCIGNNAHHLLRWSFNTGERTNTEGEDAASGFPGWHIECSAMSTKFLGQQIDIHTGGEDNIFPHHECEIAQSECSSGQQFVQLWLHKRRIDMGAEKMSKSLGNVLSVPDIVDMGYSPLDLRYAFLSVHYRTQLKFTNKVLEDAKKARRRILEWIEEMQGATMGTAGTTHEVTVFQETFTNAMNSDLNTPAALAAVFDCMAWSRNQQELTPDILGFIELVQNVFGCFDSEGETEVPAEVQALLDQRQSARDAKDFAASDALRDQIQGLGYEVRDDGGSQSIRPL